MKKVLIILLFIGCSVSAYLQTTQYRFTTYTSENGLSQNSINQIFQDSEGYLWLATQDGLNRYDGYSFKHYNTNGKPGYSLCDNFLWGIKEDKFGNLWICSRSGLNRIDRQTGQIVHFLHAPMGNTRTGNQTYSVLVSEAKVYISYSKNSYSIPLLKDYKAPTVRLDTASYAEKLTRLPQFYLSASARETNYFATQGALVIEEKGSFAEVLFPDTLSYITSQSNAMKVHDNKLWLGLSSGVYFLENHSLKQLKIKGIENIPVSDIAFDEHNQMWLAGKTGLYVVNLSDSSLIQITPEPDNPQSLAGNYVHSVYCDNSGLVWIGTANKGLQCYDSEKEQFKFLNKLSGLNDNLVWSAFKDGNGNLWVGTDQGLNKVLLEPNTSITASSFALSSVSEIVSILPEILQNKRISCFTQTSDGNIWVGTSSHGIYIINPNGHLRKHVLINNGSSISEKISALLVKDNLVWAATQNGVFQFSMNGDLVSEKYVDHFNSSPPDGYFLAMYEDRQGIIWLGSNNGVWSYNSNTKKYQPYYHNPEEMRKGPGFNFVTGFYDDGKYLWMSTFGGGVSRLNRNKRAFEHFTENDGLANNVCSGILGDKSGNIWVSTNNGLSCINSQTKSITNYSTEDGLINNEFAIGSFFSSNEGEMYFGTSQGLVMFNSRDIVPSNYHPPLSLVSLNINYKPVALSSLQNKTLHLYPDDKVFSVEFAGLNFRNSHLNKYAYTMQGFDKEWVFTDALNRKASYSSLPAGEYLLRIKASNDDGIWSKEELKLTVVVHPPFWATGWFIATMVVAILALTAVVVKYLAQRKLKRRLRKLEVKHKIQKERNRISKDLHDNIGSQITYIISSLDNAAFQSNGNGTELNEKLAELSQFSRSTMQQLRETIWVINKDEVTLNELKERTSDFIHKVSENHEIKTEVELKGNRLELKPSVAINIFRIVQEAVNNVLKHAKATELSVRYSSEKGHLIVTIKDNGVGGATEKNGHYGMKNMEDRAKEIGGKLAVNSNNGTSIQLFVEIKELNKIGQMPY